MMALAGQSAAAGRAGATTLAQDRHLGRHDLSLQRGRELLGLVEPQPKLSQTGLVVALDPPGKAPVRVDDTQATRTAPGEKPGGSLQQSVAVTATVTAIDAATRTVTLKGPKQTVSLPVSKDIDLTKVKVGDQVGAVYQESFALTVEPAKE